jgi:hypothetical protein
MAQDGNEVEISAAQQVTQNRGDVSKNVLG